MSEELDLIRRVVEGESDAFERLAARHRPVSVRLAQSLLGDADAAEDVAQEALIRLSAALPGFRGDSALDTWVYRVTLNLCQDRLRTRRRRARDVPIDHPESERSLSRQSGAERSIDVERARTAVRQALERLPDDQREAVTLRYLSDLPYREIAAILDVPMGTVASRVFRAIERLGRELEPKHLEMLK